MSNDITMENMLPPMMAMMMLAMIPALLPAAAAAEYNLILLTTEGGTVDPDPGVYVYPSGASIAITAVPDDGYVLSYWDIDGAIIVENPVTVLMDADHSARAIFALEPVTPPAPTPGKASLTVDTTPVVGPVYIDGVLYESVPVTEYLDPGDHTVIFGDVSGYYTPASMIVTLEEDDEVEITGVYEPISAPPVGEATLYITSNKAHAPVYVDGVYKGLALSPITVEVIPGLHTVSFGDITGYVTPDPITVTATQGNTVEVYGEYVPEGAPPPPPPPPPLTHMELTVTEGGVCVIYDCYYNLKMTFQPGVHEVPFEPPWFMGKPKVPSSTWVIWGVPDWQHIIDGEQCNYVRGGVTYEGTPRFVNGDVSELTMGFATFDWVITVQAEGNGTTVPEPGVYTLPSTEHTFTITAHPDPGYSHLGWILKKLYRGGSPMISNIGPEYNPLSLALSMQSGEQSTGCYPDKKFPYWITALFS